MKDAVSIPSIFFLYSNDFLADITPFLFLGLMLKKNQNIEGASRKYFLNKYAIKYLVI